MLYVSDYEGDDDSCPYKYGKSRSAERRAYTTLASVCWYWRQTLTVSQWLRNEIKKLAERECTYMYVCKCMLILFHLM